MVRSGMCMYGGGMSESLSVVCFASSLLLLLLLSQVLVYHTDPRGRDTDGDGVSDGDEVRKYHTNPLKAEL